MTEAVEEKKEVKEITEDALVQRYMDIEEHSDLYNEEYEEYLKTRYEIIKKDYKILMFQKKEARAQKRDDLEAQIHKEATKNYQARKWVIQEMRKYGIPVVDQFVI